jgi:hypothetical protein
MYSCGFSVLLFSCVGSLLAMGWSLSKEFYQLSVRFRIFRFILKWEEGRGNNPSKKKKNYLTPWIRILLEILIFAQLLKRFASIYGTRSFITVFTAVRNWTPSWIRRIQSTSLPPCFLKIHFSIIFHFAPSSSKRSLPFRFCYPIFRLLFRNLNNVQKECFAYLCTGFYPRFTGFYPLCTGFYPAPDYNI